MRPIVGRHIGPRKNGGELGKRENQHPVGEASPPPKNGGGHSYYGMCFGEGEVVRNSHGKHEYKESDHGDPWRHEFETEELKETESK